MADKQKFLVDGVGTIDQYLKAAGFSDPADNLGLKAMASLIDHTLLKPDGTKDQIEKLCGEAKEFGFKSVCVNPYWIPVAAELLKGSAVKVCTVIGFPLGANSMAIKGKETEDAINMGAGEVDMVLNIGAMKSKQFDVVEKDMAEVVKAAKGRALTKVILETCLLTNDEIKAACEIAEKAGLDYVKTSTGFSTSGANIEVVSLMRQTVGDRLGVKASGGVRNLQDLLDMVKAGATRIGASAGVAIIQGRQASGNY